jgi:hypothetical protein
MAIYLNSTSIRSGNLGKQAIPHKEKNEEWVKEMLMYFDSFASTDHHTSLRSDKNTKAINYDLINGIINREDVEYIITPFFLADNEDKSMPVEYKHYDVISPRIRFLVGEELQRPFRFYVVDKSNGSYSDYISKVADMLFEMLKGQHELLSQGVDPQLAQMNLAKLQKYKSKNIKNIFEDQASAIIEDLKIKLDLAVKFNNGLLDAVTSDEEFYQIYDKGGEPAIRLCNPLNLTFDFEEDTMDASEARLIIEENYMSIPAILDEFWDKLSDEDVKNLENLLIGKPANVVNSGAVVNYETEVITIIGDNKANTLQNRSNESLLVRRYEWKSLKKVGIIRYMDQYDQEIYDIVNEYYEIPDDAEQVTIDHEKFWSWFDGEKDVLYQEKWINEYWHAIKINNELVIDWGPNKYQRRNLDNPSVCKSSYVGKVYTARNSVSTSLVERMKTLQYFFNFIMYETELAYMRAAGRGFVMDLAQKPDNLTLEEFIYYLKSVGIAFIDSTKNKNGFNQFTDFDLSVGGYINQNFELLKFIQYQLEMLSGVPDQRLGQVQASELVGNVNTAIAQSSAITSYIYFTHDSIKQEALNALLDLALQLYEKGKTIYYVTDDVGRIFTKLHEDINSKSLGIYLSNSTLDDRNLNSLKQNALGALQSGTIDFATLGKITLSTSVNQIMNILEESQEEAGQRAKENADAERGFEAELAMLNHKNQMELNNANIQKDIDVALIGKSDEEYDKLKLQMEQKYKDKDNQIKVDQLNEVIRSNKAQEILKEREIAIKKLTATNKPKTTK